MSTLMNVVIYISSNKKGQVVSVSHSLPPSRDGGFASYKDMKRYWKNTYGYRLPETDDDLFYFQVNFKLIGSKLFTYPRPKQRVISSFFQPTYRSYALLFNPPKMFLVCI